MSRISTKTAKQPMRQYGKFLKYFAWEWEWLIVQAFRIWPEWNFLPIQRCLQPINLYTSPVPNTKTEWRKL